MLTTSTRTRDFPSLASIAYLNTAAESIPPQCVGDAIASYTQGKLRGMKGRDEHFPQVEACREVSARMLGLQTSEVSFCSCSSEAYNLLASALQLGATDEVVVTDLDFPAGVTPWMRAACFPALCAMPPPSAGRWLLLIVPSRTAKFHPKDIHDPPDPRHDENGPGHPGAHH